MHTPFHNQIETTVNVETTSREVRTGVTTSVVEEFSETRADRVVSTNIAQSMRSRDITVTGENFKPTTKYYVFFDGIDVNAHMTPTSATYGVADGTAKGTRLRSDSLGKISATFTIPSTSELNFSTGSTTLKLTDSPINDANSRSQGSSIYEANGQIAVIHEEIISTRNGRVIKEDISEERFTTSVENRTEVTWVDPLAQSFLVEIAGGIFVTSVEVYFGAKDISLPVSVQLRHMENGTPTQKLLAFGEKTLYPASVNTSADASTSTKFTFPSPVYLEAGREYCAVLMSNSNEYTAWVSEMGARDIATNDFIDQQPYAGSLFKSQNNSTWTPDQMRDLKIKINRAKFDTQPEKAVGSVVFENAAVAADTLAPSPIETISGTKTFRVLHYSHGIYDQTTSNVTIAGVVGDRTGSIFSFNDDTVAASGTVTADAQSLAGTAQSLSTGTGCVATITTTTSATTAVVITNPGQGFDVGDTVRFTKDNETIDLTVGAVKETLGGIPIEYINTTHNAGTSASGSDAGSRFLCDIDEYLITIPLATWPTRVDENDATPNYAGATESTSGGGESVTATPNVYYDTLHTVIPSIELPNTSITPTFLGTDATQPISGSDQEAYSKDSSSTTITLNDNNVLSKSKIVASGINESEEMGSTKSFSLTCQLNSTANNVSPVLDVDTMGFIGIQNRINNIDVTGDLVASAGIVSTEARGDSNAAIYMTKRCNLKNSANALHILFDGYKAPDASGTDPQINIYYKILGPDSNLQFNDVGWILAPMLVDNVVVTVPADASDFQEHIYEIEGLEDFTTFSIKAVLQSVNSTNVPLIENFRAIALST